ncbi:MAG: glycosyltransferase family 4 protein [Bacteroidota bacterium]
MKIGLNLLYLIPGIVGGTETYARGVVQGLSGLDAPDEFFIFLNRDAADWTIPDKGNFHKVICDTGASNQGARYLYEQTTLPRLARQYHLDVLHSLGYTSPLRTPCKSIVTIHDLNFISFGSKMPLLRRLGLGSFVRLGAWATDHVIAVSEFSREEIQRYLRVPNGKVTVIHEAPHPSREPYEGENNNKPLLRFQIAQPYWIAFSSISPNKNIPNLLRALSIVRRQYGLQSQLVLIGHRPPHGEIATVLDDNDKGIVFTGYINDGDVLTILSGAQMMIFPSLYEGFGLPVVEAMALGVPVTCSTAASLPEIAGRAALFFDPNSPDDIAEKIAKLAGNTEEQELMRRRGFENIKRFSWSKAARETMQVYQKVIGEHSLN